MGHPVLGKYFDDILPVDGKPFAKVADSTTKDVELALDVAHQAKDAWAKTSPAKRADILLKIADLLEANLELLAVAETWENDKPIRETFVQYRRTRLDKLPSHYPVHAAFSDYKQSGIGRENHKMMLEHYQQTKNLLVNYSLKALGFFQSSLLNIHNNKAIPIFAMVLFF